MFNRTTMVAALAALLLSRAALHAQVRSPDVLHLGFTDRGLGSTLDAIPSWNFPEAVGFSGLLLDRASFGLVGPVKHIRVERAELPRGGEYKDDAPPPPDGPETRRGPLYESSFDERGRVISIRTWDPHVDGNKEHFELRYSWDGDRLASIDCGPFGLASVRRRILPRYDDKGRILEVVGEKPVDGLDAAKGGAWRREYRNELVFEGDRPVQRVLELDGLARTETIIRRDEGGYRVQRFPDAQLNFASSHDVDLQGRVVRVKIAKQPATVYDYDTRGRWSLLQKEDQKRPHFRRLPDDPTKPGVSVIEERNEGTLPMFLLTETTTRDAHCNAVRVEVRVAWKGKEPPGDFSWFVTDHRMHSTIEYFAPPASPSRLRRSKPVGEL